MACQPLLKYQRRNARLSRASILVAADFGKTVGLVEGDRFGILRLDIKFPHDLGVRKAGFELGEDIATDASCAAVRGGHRAYGRRTVLVICSEHDGITHAADIFAIVRHQELRMPSFANRALQLGRRQRSSISSSTFAAP